MVIISKISDTPEWLQEDILSQGGNTLKDYIFVNHNKDIQLKFIMSATKYVEYDETQKTEVARAIYARLNNFIHDYDDLRLSYGLILLFRVIKS